MTKPRVILTLPDTDRPDRFVPLVILLESLVDINEYHLRRALAEGNPYPRLYRSGVRYKEEAPGREDWPDIPRVLSQGWGDCEDLAAYLAAERRVYDGVDAEAVIKWKWIPTSKMLAAGWPKRSLPRDGVWLVHCLVRYPDGSIEDPSKLLGMGGEYTETL
jgi:hypothetical protein